MNACIKKEESKELQHKKKRRVMESTSKGMYIEHRPNIVLNIVVAESRPKIPQLILCSFSPSPSMLKSIIFQNHCFDKHR
jgi:hypothetical protein